VNLSARSEEPDRLVLGLGRAFGSGGRGRLAARVAARLGGRVRPAFVDAVLVLAADHELNVSAFASRVAASARATLPACVGAALYVFTGPVHGGACDRIEGLVRSQAAAAIADEHLRAGVAVPGFGHPLYPDGDPRAAPLLARARAGSGRTLANLLRLVDLVERRTGLRANVDLALVGACLAEGAPPGTATGLFALGRSAGWIAHALEQRQSAALLRPRARYVGP